MIKKIKNFYKNLKYKTVECEIVETNDKKIELQQVYNIEVEGNHNYFANNILVSNCHVLKNSRTQRSKNFHEISKDTEKVWLLTGTPINNRPMDYHNLLKIIKHPIATNWMKFVERYCAGFKEYGVWNTKGASNLEELHEKTKSAMLRRLKKDYVNDLPNKDRSPVFLHLDNKKEYDNVVNAYREAKLAEMFSDSDYEGYSDMFDTNDFDVGNMTKFLLWRQYCALKKVEDGSLLELIETQVDEGRKVVVFTNFTKVVDAVYEKFGHEVCRFVDGRESDVKKRLNTVKEFNDSDSLRVLVCNLKVGSTGLNIQSANVAIINDMDWVPSTMLQAEDRLWRIGQKNDVSILYPIYKGTVEEIVFNVINEKMRHISTAIEGKTESYFGKNEEKDSRETLTQQRLSILDDIFSQLG